MENKNNIIRSLSANSSMNIYQQMTEGKRKKNIHNLENRNGDLADDKLIKKMSNYIPFLSSSPPPLESKDSLEEDEFGSFSHAEYINEECEINSLSGAKILPVNSCDRIDSDSDEKEPAWIKEKSLSFKWNSSSSQFDMGSDHFNSTTSDSPECSRSARKDTNSELSLDAFPQAKGVDEDSTKLELTESEEHKYCFSDDQIDEEISDRIVEENNINCVQIANSVFSSMSKSDGCDNIPSDNEDWADFSSAPSDIAVTTDFSLIKDAADSELENDLGVEFYTKQIQTARDTYSNFRENYELVEGMHHEKPTNYEHFRSTRADNELDSSCKDLGNISKEPDKYYRTGLATPLKNGDHYTGGEVNVEKSINKLQVTDFELDENLENYAASAQSDLKSLSSMSDEYVDSSSRVDNVERNFVSDDQKETVISDEFNVISSDQQDDVNDEDEFADFVSPSDDGQASIRNHHTKDTDSALGTDTSEISCNDCSEQHTAQEDIETFQPTFEANFDEEFGTYSFASSNSVPQGSTNMHNIDDVINKSFPVNMLPLTEESVVEALEETLKPKNGSSRPEHNSWSQLSDFEKTNALTYHWNNSQANKTLLKALNIDSRNLLFGRNWNSSIPIFAANLSFNPLEPIKMTWKPEEKSAASCSDPDNTKNLDADDSKGIIPPAQFDWNSSGLVNPLDAANNSSTLLDLDFFFTHETTIKPVPSATWSLENELLGPNADNQTSKMVPTSSKVSPLLEQILSNAKLSTSKFPKPKEPTVLSAEAQRIISHLPDLNFMQAKVLMFPIRNISP